MSLEHTYGVNELHRENRRLNLENDLLRAENRRLSAENARLGIDILASPQAEAEFRSPG